MTSVEIPVSIAAALPNLTVLDITNEVRREVASTGGSGGPDFGGVIFKLTPPQNQGDPWTETVLHSFGGPDGFRSLSRLVRRGGAMYGTTSAGGLNGTGTVFALTF